MEIGVTVHLTRRRPRALDLVVRWEGRHDARRLREALSDHLGLRVDGLLAGGRPVPDGAVVGMPPLLDGVALVVAPTAPRGTGSGAAASASTTAALELVVVGGPDAGRSRALLPPGLDIGRRPGRGMCLEDASLSRDHARVAVGPEGVRITDLGSTNGVIVDGQPILGPTRLDTRSTVVVGGTTLRLRRPDGVGPPLTFPGDGTVVPAPTRAPAGATEGVHVEAPEAPAEPAPARLPWLAALVPIPVALVLVAVLGAQFLAFALLAPVMVLGSALGERWSGRRRRRAARADHERARHAADERLAAALAEEQRIRDREHPDPHAVLQRVERRLGGLWSGCSGSVRLGVGDVEARTTWGPASRPGPVVLRQVPVVLDLAGLERLGIVGDPEYCRRVVDWVVGQLCASLPPGRLSLSPGRGATASAGWGRVPHAGPPGGGAALTLRWPADGAGGGADGTPGPCTTIHAATRREDLPAGCDAVLEREDSGRQRLSMPDGAVVDVTADGVGGWWVERMSRALAPLRLPRPAQHGDGPGPLALGDLVGPRRLGAAGIDEHWAAHGADGPLAVVGRTGRGTFRLDLRRDGAHVLVGGTTGSGKSEFLRTLVTGLALESPPERLCLLLVDFKGGAAFGPCRDLPHVVGLVTDLDDHLVDRVLRSLRAELRRRERVLASAGASDIDVLLRASGEPPLPRLVVVVDELRALAEEYPGFVDGLVRLAAQGRSLGIHLVLATQRPSGTVTAEIQANIELRIAFRVRDRSDSVDVLEAPAAADISPGTPGRGYARGGDGVLTPFQSALVASSAPVRPYLEVGDAGSREEPATCRRAPEQDRAAATAEVVASVVAAAAARRVEAPAPPWLPPLPVSLRRGDAHAHPGVIAVVDEPDRQRRRSLVWDPAVSLWRVVGPPRSGRTAAAHTIVTSAAEVLPPDALHVHVIDAGAGLDELEALPHLGTRCRTDDPQGVADLVERLAAEVAARRSAGSSAADPAPHLVVVVDGWEQLVEADDPRASEPLSDVVLRVLRDGAGVGVSGVVTGGRPLLGSRWSALGDDVLLLGRVDPLDAVAVGLRERDLPHEPPPGRGVHARGPSEVQVVHTTEGDVARIAARSPEPLPHRRPWRHRPLPLVVRRCELDDAEHDRAHRDDEPADDGGRLLVGVAGPTATPWHWVPQTTAGRLVVLGPPRSGRSTALRTLAESALRSGRTVALVDAGGRQAPSIPGSVVTAVGPDDVTALARMRHANPRLVVLVDDVDRLDDAPVLPVVAEIAELAARDGGAVAVATTTAALATRFRGLDVDTARLGCGIVLAPGGADGDLLGARVPTGPRHPGRGVAVIHGETTPVQVLLAPPGADRAGSARQGTSALPRRPSGLRTPPGSARRVVEPGHPLP